MTFAYSVSLTDLGGSSDALLVTDLGGALSDWSKYIIGLGTPVINLIVGASGAGIADGGPTDFVPDGTAAGGATLLEPSSLYEPAR